MLMWRPKKRMMTVRVFHSVQALIELTIDSLSSLLYICICALHICASTRLLVIIIRWMPSLVNMAKCRSVCYVRVWKEYSKGKNRTERNRPFVSYWCMYLTRVLTYTPLFYLFLFFSILYHRVSLCIVKITSFYNGTQSLEEMFWHCVPRDEWTKSEWMLAVIGCSLSFFIYKLFHRVIKVQINDSTNE